MPRPPRWTAKENALLRRWYRRLEIWELSDLLGRTECAVKSHLVDLGLRRHDRAPRLSASEEAVLRRDYGHRPADAIAAELGRTGTFVRNAAFRLGLRAQRRFDTKTMDSIREHHAAGMNDGEIAAAIGMERRIVSYFRARLGLAEQGRHERYRAKVREKTRRQLDAAGVPTLAHLRAKRFRDYARESGWPEDLRPRAVQILEALKVAGPMTRKQIAAAVGLPWRGSRKSLCSRDPEGSYLAHLKARGLVVQWPKVIRGKGRGHSVRLYSLPFGKEQLASQQKESADGQE